MFGDRHSSKVPIVSGHPDKIRLDEEIFCYIVPVELEQPVFLRNCANDI